MDELVADLHTGCLARARTAGRVALVGESFGGALTLSYALAHPERVERLVILNSFAHFASPARLSLGYHLLRATPWPRDADGPDVERTPHALGENRAG